MVAPRKKTSGFSSKPSESTEEVNAVEEFLEQAASEILEEKVEVAPPAPVIESITPSEDPGPRFVEEPKAQVTSAERKAPKKPKLLEIPEEGTTRVVVTPEKPPTPQAAPPAPVVHPPKRNPRNVPRFSRIKK